MLKLVLPKKSYVSDFEIKRGGSSYTIESVKYFRSKYPNAQLFTLIGSDNLPKLNKWKKIEEISKLSKIVIFKRSKKFSKINIKRYNATLLNNDIWELSSSAFKKLHFEQIEDSVREYIGKNFLYAKEILYTMMDGDQDRHKHSIATSESAAIYAKVYGQNSKKAWFAGLFHDITKTQPKTWHREFLKEYGHENS